MRNWSPYCTEPLSAHESIHWLWLAYVHMGAYGTPHYEPLDADVRRLFENKLADDSWRIVPDRLRGEAMLEGVTFSAEMLSAEAMRYAHAIGPGKPLPPGDRRGCVRLASELHPISTRLQTRAWIEHPRPPAGWKVQDSQSPGYVEKAERVFAALLGELRPQHAPDFAWVRCLLGEFHFSTNQRHVIRALWADWEVGGLGLGQAYLLDLAGSDASKRLRDLFKNEAAWDVLVVSGERKDTFRLALDNAI